MRLFSYKNRPVHLGPYPLETLKRSETAAPLSAAPPMQAVSFSAAEPESINHAMSRYQAMLDAIRDGMVKQEKGEIPSDLRERSEHLKAFGYYHDASQIGICKLQPEMLLAQPINNPAISELVEQLKNQQTTTLAAGIDVVMAELKETMEAPAKRIDHHSHAIVFLYEYPRDPGKRESGTDWIQDSQAQRACLRAAETTAVLSNYIRLLGYEARGHSGACSDIDLNKLALASGIGQVVQGDNGPMIINPYLGRAFGLGAITTTLELACDKPLANNTGVLNRLHSHGPIWWLGGSPGRGFAKRARRQRPFAKRLFKQGQFAFEKLKRIASSTTFIDEPRVARVPKRADMFARAIFGDMGKPIQDAARNGNYVRKSAASFGPRRPLAAFVLLQDGPKAAIVAGSVSDAQRNADNVKATLYFLGADAVGISRCPEWAYYSHDALGEVLAPYHSNAISVVIDQGHETMDGASGDDWIACSQSMRAYLRFSLLGSVVAEQIRKLGYSARSHTVMDGEVLQPPLLLLSGLGEVSRIGEVILNPFLGPRLKSGTITTNMPLSHDLPIDFGLQNFCNNCNKCARECPSGAITAGPKTMFNGYEIWKSDSQKCTQYRITQAAGAMCGRCMKTCPWNLEGLFSEAPFRWAASHIPLAARALAKLDDAIGNGSINPVKKWWWDLEMVDDGPYTLSPHGSNKRQLQKDLNLKFEDQTLAVYPANLAPPPYPFPFPMDREAGIQAYKDMLSPSEYRAKLARGETANLAHQYSVPVGPEPVIRVIVSKVESMTKDINKYEFSSLNGEPLPKFAAGAHIDVVVAPEFFRQYSLSGNPADRSKYQIGVLREDEGRGGSNLLHKIFTKGRKVFISRPINHFALEPDASKTFLMGGGIGVTPMIAMGHELYAKGKDFELHYSCSKRDRAGFIEDLNNVVWAEKISCYFSDQGERIDLDTVLNHYQDGYYLYTCGPDRYMNAVLETGANNAWPLDTLRKEYFTIPETPEYKNHSFTLKLTNSGQEIAVDPEQTAAEALVKAGFPINVKCADGICGVCKCQLVEGEVEHRDFVLSQKQQQTQMILCQSRAAEAGAVITIEL